MSSALSGTEMLSSCPKLLSWEHRCCLSVFCFFANPWDRAAEKAPFSKILSVKTFSLVEQALWLEFRSSCNWSSEVVSLFRLLRIIGCKQTSFRPQLKSLISKDLLASMSQKKKNGPVFFTVPKEWFWFCLCIYPLQLFTNFDEVRAEIDSRTVALVGDSKVLQTSLWQTDERACYSTFSRHEHVVVLCVQKYLWTERARHVFRYIYIYIYFFLQKV